MGFLLKVFLFFFFKKILRMKDLNIRIMMHLGQDIIMIIIRICGIKELIILSLQVLNELKKLNRFFYN